MGHFTSVCCTVLINCAIVYSSAEWGPVGPITIYEIKHCDPDVNAIEYEVKLNEEGNDKKNLDFNFKLREDYGEEVKLTVVIDKYANNDWQEDVYDTEFSFLDFMNEHLPKLLENFLNAVSPKIEDGTVIPAGEYKLTGYKEDYHNIEQDQIIYGRLRNRSLEQHVGANPYNLLISRGSNTAVPTIDAVTLQMHFGQKMGKGFLTMQVVDSVTYNFVKDDRSCYIKNRSEIRSKVVQYLSAIIAQFVCMER